MTIGLLLLTAAFALTLYNFWDADRARKASNEAVDELEKQIPIIPPDGEEMPTIEINGHRYIGILQIPSLGLALPVMEEWDYTKLKISPCRYSGSYYTKDLVICGHNYARHFSPIKWIDHGVDVYFENVQGIKFHYKVSKKEILRPTQIDKMITSSDDWDLSLFTCTTGGRTRCTIRCVEVEK